MNVVNVIKKLLRGESIATVRQPQWRWDKQFASGKWRHSEELGQNLSVVLRMVIEESMKRPIRVLDVGCGSAVLGQYLLQGNPNITYVGTDISREALRQAKERVPQGTFHCSNMANDPQLQQRFDVIVFAEVLLYTDFMRALELHRPYLKEEGLLIISLYQTLRTRYIWHKLKSMLKVRKHIYLRDVPRRISWRIFACTYQQ